MCAFRCDQGRGPALRPDRARKSGGHDSPTLHPPRPRGREPAARLPRTRRRGRRRCATARCSSATPGAGPTPRGASPSRPARCSACARSPSSSPAPWCSMPSPIRPCWMPTCARACRGWNSRHPVRCTCVTTSPACATTGRSRCCTARRSRRRSAITEAARVIAGTRTLHFAPGTRYSYVNQNFRMLSDILQERTGRSFARAAAHAASSSAPAWRRALLDRRHPRHARRHRGLRGHACRRLSRRGEPHRVDR